jgi:hypothetical protein
MQLEILPNELLIYLFEFFDSIHLLRAFFGLNSRFNDLVYTHLRTHQVNFQSISKGDFDIICHQHLPLLINHIITLRFSNEETPDIFDLLLSRGFVLDRFIRLQSLSLHYIQSLDTLIKITHQCRNLPSLTHFNIINCHFEMKPKHNVDLFNNIWSIPKLTHCNLNGLTSFSQLSVISSSIEVLFIENISYDLNCLSRMLKCTPYLRSLSTKIYSHSSNDNLTFVIPSIISLKIFFQGSIDSMKSIFLNMPNLIHLTVETFDMDLNGHVWEQIISDYFPQIKEFNLKMKLECSGNDNDLEKNVDQLLLTFQTNFWLIERQWYVRCDWESSEISTFVTLYTLPFGFNTIYYLNECRTKSTCIDEEKYRSYKAVEVFESNHLKSLTFRNFNLVCGQFPNLRCLDIVLPFDEGFHMDNVILNHLTSLTIRIQIASAYSQLQTICDRAPHLYSLRIIFWQKFTTKLFQLTSKSIRRLNLGGMFDWSNEFTKEECIAFSNCILGRQCEVLSIEIEDRKSIIDLIERISNLRLLNVRCRDDRWDYRKIPSSEYELVHWIQNRFPSTFTIIRNREKSSCIQIWIDRQGKHSKRDPFLLKGGHKVSTLFSSVQKFFSKK